MRKPMSYTFVDSTGASHVNAVAEGREGATTITTHFPSPSYKPFVFTGQQRQLPILKKKNPPTNPRPSRHPEVNQVIIMISKLSFGHSFQLVCAFL
jgi:hypothetical protein